MTKQEAIEQLEKSLDLWWEFCGEASHYISDEDMDAIELLIKLAKQDKI